MNFEKREMLILAILITLKIYYILYTSTSLYSRKAVWNHNKCKTNVHSMEEWNEIIVKAFIFLFSVQIASLIGNFRLLGMFWFFLKTKNAPLYLRGIQIVLPNSLFHIQLISGLIFLYFKVTDIWWYQLITKN